MSSLSRLVGWILQECIVPQLRNSYIMHAKSTQTIYLPFSFKKSFSDNIQFPDEIAWQSAFG